MNSGSVRSLGEDRVLNVCCVSSFLKGIVGWYSISSDIVVVISLRLI